jgi:hypothetical protein
MLHSWLKSCSELCWVYTLTTAVIMTPCTLAITFSLPPHLVQVIHWRGKVGIKHRHIPVQFTTRTAVSEGVQPSSPSSLQAASVLPFSQVSLATAVLLFQVMYQMWHSLGVEVMWDLIQSRHHVARLEPLPCHTPGHLQGGGHMQSHKPLPHHM